MSYLLYRALRRLAMRLPWRLARHVYALAFRCLEHHNRKLPAIDWHLFHADLSVNDPPSAHPGLRGFPFWLGRRRIERTTRSTSGPIGSQS